MKVPGRYLVVVLILPILLTAQERLPMSRVLPAPAAAQLARSLEVAAAHTRHIWRDTSPTNADSTVNAYVEIPRGDRRKWEFDMRNNVRAFDRVIPEHVGGYPVNYGFVPQTVFYDGDPFDALVLGPPIAGGALTRGVIVGLMYMEDEKGIDSKVVLSPIGPDGSQLYQLTATDREEIGAYFRRYKLGEPGAFSTVPGWGSIAEGRAHVSTANAFFRTCRTRAVGACQLTP